MDWRVQVVKSGVVNRLPFERGIRRAKRRLIGYYPDESNLQQTLADYEWMTSVLRSVSRSFEDSVALEVGSGWFPTIPLMLAREGARHVYLTDLTPNMDEATFQATLRFVAGRVNWREAEGKTFADFPFSYLAPFEPKQLRDGSLDFVVSRAVLEHVPRDDLPVLFSTLRDKLSRDGLMVHIVDHSDHLAHVDASLSMVNFLTWSPRRHRVVSWIAGGGENRLRHHEYIPIFEAAGLEVMATDADVHEPTRRVLRTLRLAPPYADMEPDTLAVLRSIYVLRRR